MLKTISGDLFANANAKDSCIIIHGCNAQGKMKSGFAKELRQRFPFAYTKYMEAAESAGLRLGTNVIANCGQICVVNAITQEFYGRDSSFLYVSYDAVEKCLRSIVNGIKDTGWLDIPVHLPFIGGGLANGDRDRLHAIFTEVFIDNNATLWLSKRTT